MALTARQDQALPSGHPGRWDRLQRLWQERATWGRGGAACRGAGLLCTGQARFPEPWPYYVVPSGFLSPSAWRGWPGLGSLGKRRPVEDTGGPGGHPEVCTAPLERGGFTWQLGSDSQAKNVGTHHRIGSPWSGASDTNLPAGMGGGGAGGGGSPWVSSPCPPRSAQDGSITDLCPGFAQGSSPVPSG